MLSKLTAVITGAARVNGVGAATAKLLAARGYNIVINGVKNKEQADAVAAECRDIGADVDVHIADLTVAENCRELKAMVEARCGKVDVLVNCMGLTKSASYDKLEALTSDDFHRLFAVNAIAPYQVVEALKPLLMKAESPVIINVSSNAGLTGKGSSIAYAVAKGAENTLTLALALALSPHIRVNAVCPSFIDSSWWEESYAGREESYALLIKSMSESNPLKRVLKPLDVAKTILAAIDNPALTGELLRLDSGVHLGKTL